jgi:hypothetical protein
MIKKEKGTKLNIIKFVFLLFLTLSFKNKVNSDKIESNLCGLCKISFKLFDDFKIKDMSYLDTCDIYIESKKEGYRETIDFTLSNSISIYDSDFLKNRILTLKSAGYGLYLTSPFLYKQYNDIKYLCIVNYKENLKSFIIENKNITNVIKDVNTFMTNLYVVY